VLAVNGLFDVESAALPVNVPAPCAAELSSENVVEPFEPLNPARSLTLLQFGSVPGRVMPPPPPPTLLGGLDRDSI